jgi:hypothetical protein
MTPHRIGPPSCWHSGGNIERCSGGLSRRRAVRLFAFYVREALAGFAENDAAKAIFCARNSLELAEAICEAELWGRAAAPPAADCEARVRRENSREWLTNASTVKELLNYLDSLGRT